MRRGSYRLRSLSASRAGRIPVGYLREVLVVSVLMLGVIALQQPFRPAAASVQDQPHSTHPVYGLSVSQNDSVLWISRERYGMSQIRLADGTEAEHSMLCQAEASYAAHGGQERPLTLRYGHDLSLELFRDQPVHHERLANKYQYISDSDVSADGQHAAIITLTGSMKSWHDRGDGEFESREHDVPQQLDHLALSRDGRRAVLVSWEYVVVWDMESGSEIRRWHVKKDSKLPFRSNRAEAVDLSSDDTYVALAFENGVVRVWECATAKLTWEHQVDSFKASTVAFSPSGKAIATGGFDNHVRLWDWRNNQMLWEQSHHWRAVHNVVFAADESRLYSGGLDGQVVEYVANTGAKVRTLP
jgi:WD40 repeat protein